VIQFACPECGKSFKVSEGAGGKRGKCPQCGAAVTAPEGAPMKRVSRPEPLPAVEGARNEFSQDEGQAVAASLDTKACQYCGETIKAAAVKCKHCGSDLLARANTLPGQVNPLYDRQSAESVIYEGPVSQWTNLGTFIFCGFVALGGFIILIVPDVPFLAALGVWAFAALVAFLSWFNVRFLVYRVTTERVEIEKGWISKRIENLDMFRVLDVRLNIGVFDRLVGIGNVNVISSDKTTPNVTIRGLHNAREVYERLKRESVRADRRRGVIHVET
jgi:membrane protein YdbS with pleckstrin-like domain/predicted RNA-binding Zn-ribbon protein involved in translation (DUF1610 family)